MTTGASSTRASAILNVYRATAYSAVTPFVQLHTGDPGSAGTANVSAVTTRNAISFNAPSAGSMPLNTLASYSMTASESISHVSIWSASTAGTFQESYALSSPVPVVNGSTLSFTTFTLSISPLAA